jgi:phosphoadenosine phosphosulfate reductase
MTQTNDLVALNGQFETATPEALLKWAAETYPGQIKVACSFGAEDVALLDMIARNELPFIPFALDTGRLHQETYDVFEEHRKKYGIEIQTFHPNADKVASLVSEKGPNSFYNSILDRKECCYIRKVEPLERALKGTSGWVTGLRREQSVTRNALAKIEVDADHGGILKLNPLADWNEEQVWEYIRRHNVPYNKLHDQGFPSIGCAPCTRAIRPGEDVRAGRWWWEEPEHKECGLHLKVNP